jgi:serine/threonine-protein kinase RsbT
MASNPLDKIRLPVKSDVDIVLCRQKGREMAVQMGFPYSDGALIATAISELARNIVKYAKSGEITISPMEIGGETGIQVIARDRGPGIRNIDLAMQDGYSTSGGLGLGLPGVRRLMDTFEILSTNTDGTTVTTTKWRR